MRDQLVSFKIGDLRCNRCKRRGKRRCFHHKVCDSVRVAALLEELECELGDYYERHGRQFDDISKKSRIKTDPTQADKATDVNHIEFVLPENNNEQVKEYTQFISRECYIHGIPLQASRLEDWITSLKACIAMEN